MVVGAYIAPCYLMKNRDCRKSSMQSEKFKEESKNPIIFSEMITVNILLNLVPCI